MIKSRNYSRKSTASLSKRKRTGRGNNGARFLLKLIVFFLLVGLVLGGGYWGGRKLYRTISQARLSDWHVKSVAVAGITGDLNKALLALASVHQNKPFTIKNAVQLRQNIIKKYPMLTDVSVKRGLFSGKLTVFAKHRVPLAKFIRPDGSVSFIDKDSTVYADPNPGLLSEVPSVALEGKVPEKLSSEFIDLVESTLKLNKELNFTFLQMNLTDNTVRMHLPDGNEIDFGSAVQLKQKAARAAQIMAIARGKYKTPFVLHFAYFENGKVFLTQKAP
ncbi:hypothetical protein [Candidatus Avelusimicrobium luingense]|uniref:hypothetical protein n=1 Tax=Candidatus Avelusimicrobium luingense TaxID=3416211 RepID=UPI003D0B731D